MHIAAVTELRERVIPGLKHLHVSPSAFYLLFHCFPVHHTQRMARMCCKPIDAYRVP